MEKRNDTEASVNRTYKSTVFAMLFEDRRNLLELYNAVSGKNYTDPELLEINTLDNAIYMAMRNDLSFVIDGRLSLYEHQSTRNPNLPLRFLFYISNLYSGITKDRNLYGTRRIELPRPEFLVFYNGPEELPERQILRLSEMYSGEEGETRLELEVVLLNICGEKNKEIKEACRTLREYAEYTDRIRRYTKEMSLNEAVERAIQECIREGILKDFLEKHRTEAKTMSIFEYDQEKHMRMEREEAMEDGIQKGIQKGIQAEKARIIENMLRCGVSEKEAHAFVEGPEESRDQAE